MTTRQRARRAAYWRGAALPIAFFTAMMLLSALADRITQ